MCNTKRPETFILLAREDTSSANEEQYSQFFLFLSDPSFLRLSFSTPSAPHLFFLFFSPFLLSKSNLKPFPTLVRPMTTPLNHPSASSQLQHLENCLAESSTENAAAETFIQQK